MDLISVFADKTATTINSTALLAYTVYSNLLMCLPENGKG